MTVADALLLSRPGGGESYHGGGGHGGGGGAAVFELVFYLFRLLIWYPQIGVPLLLAGVGYVIYSAYKQQKNKDWDSGPPVELKRATDLAPLRRADPDFSQAVFEDFAFRLFSAAHRARHPADALATLAPYVSPAARAHLAQRAPTGTRVESVVVGAMRAIRLDLPPDLAPYPATTPQRHPDPEGDDDDLDAAPPPAPAPPRTRIALEFEANITTATETTYTVETWTLGRAATARSKPPGHARTFPCPNCGAPWQAARTGTQVCASCGEAVDNGRFDWVVETIALRSANTYAPTLTEDVPERGTDLPTYRAPDVDDAWDALATDDPAVTEDALALRAALISKNLNAAWSANALAPVRGLVSDGLYDYLQYWVDAYVRQGLRNVLVDMTITHTVVAKVVRDKWYDAVTIRIWGSGVDYVVRSETGRVVRGKKHATRAYSEYWTLIRAAGKRGAPHADATCGNCGAPLQITMAGECEHCHAHVTAGEFDWVLSKIEQDDSYRG